MMAPMILVAANSIAKRMTANKIVPKIPINTAFRVEQRQEVVLCVKLAAISVTARYTTAIPKTTHKKGVVTVIAAVICRKAEMIPRIKLATIAIPVQLKLFL